MRVSTRTQSHQGARFGWAVISASLALVIGIVACGVVPKNARLVEFGQNKDGQWKGIIEKDMSGDPITLTSGMPDDVCWDAVLLLDGRIVHHCSDSEAHGGEPLVGSEPCVIPASVEFNEMRIVTRPCDGAEGPPDLVYEGEPLESFPLGSTYIPFGPTRHGFVDTDLTSDMDFSAIKTGAVLAYSDEEARAMFDAMEPGSPVFPGMEPGLRVTVGGDETTAFITSDLPSRFTAFRVVIDGEVWAQKGDNIYTTQTGLGNGWVRMTVTLPTTLFADAESVVVEQQGPDDAEPYAVSVLF